MCHFFSCVSDGKGRLFFFDAVQRASLRKNNPENYEPDSHTSIADFYGYKGAKEDILNKYEFNPLTQEFVIDQINTKDDSVSVEKKLRKLDFKTIVPELVIKPIINPLLVVRPNYWVTTHELDLLKQWDSVWDSVRAYTSSFFMLPKWKYVDHKIGENPFQCCIDLWEGGLIPSFDGKVWRLHAGPNAKVVWEGTL
jgi:hypothetical protein